MPKVRSAEIFKAAKEMGYIGEVSVSRIKLVIYQNAGVIVNDTPFFNLLIDGFEKECRAFGYEMALCHLNRRDEGYEQQVRDLLNDTTTAVVLLGTELMENEVDLYKSARCPFLTLDYWYYDMSFNGVLINNSDSARVAVEY